MDRFCKYLFCLLVVLIFSGCIEDEVEPGSGLQPGDELPEFVITSGEGLAARKSDLIGKVSLLVFFNTGCPDCREELPIIQQIYDEYSANQDFYILCIATSADDEVEKYWEENRLSVPYIIPSDNSLVEALGLKTIPHVYVSDRSATIRYVYGDSPIASFENLSEAIGSLLCLKQ